MTELAPRTTRLFPLVQNLINNRLVMQKNNSGQGSILNLEYMEDFCKISINSGRRSGHTQCMLDIIDEYPTAVGVVNTDHMAKSLGNSRIFPNHSSRLGPLGSSEKYNMLVFDSMNRLDIDNCIIRLLNDGFLNLSDPFICIELGCV